MKQHHTVPQTIPDRSGAFYKTKTTTHTRGHAGYILLKMSKTQHYFMQQWSVYISWPTTTIIIIVFNTSDMMLN